MKKIILTLLVLLFLFGCTRESKIGDIKLIPHYGSEYKKVSGYEKYIQQLIPTEMNSKIVVDTKEIFSKVNGIDKIKEPINFELFISANGKIEKVKTPSNIDDSVSTSLVKKMNDWKFGKYVQDGIPIKYKMDLSLGVYKHKEINILLYGTAVEEIDNEIYYLIVEEMPIPIGGMRAIQEKIIYPEKAKTSGIEGRVFVKAYLDSTGTVAEAKILKGIGHGCDKVALDAVKSVQFIPGRQRGKTVNVQVVVPILFKLQ